MFNINLGAGVVQIAISLSPQPAFSLPGVFMIELAKDSQHSRLALLRLLADASGNFPIAGQWKIKVRDRRDPGDSQPEVTILGALK